MTVAKLHDPDGHYNIVEGAAPIEFLLDRVKSPWSTMNQTEIPRDLSTFEAFIRAACAGSRRYYRRRVQGRRDDGGGDSRRHLRHV